MVPFLQRCHDANAKEHCVLSVTQMERIHGAALEILERVGVRVRHPHMRELLAQAGATANHDTEMVRFPSGLIKQVRAKSMPKNMTPPALDPIRVNCGMTGLAPNIYDVEQDAVRPARAADQDGAARLAQALLDGHGDILFIPQDVRVGMQEVYAYASMMLAAGRSSPYPRFAAGLLGPGGVVGSLERVLIDRDVCDCLNRFTRSFEVTDETLAKDLIAPDSRRIMKADLREERQR